MQNAPREHSAILLTFIKLTFVFKTFVLSIFEWSLKAGFTVEGTELNTHVYTSIEARGLMFGMSLHLYQNFVYASIQVSDESYLKP